SPKYSSCTFLCLNLKLLHCDEILNEGLSKGTADHVILCQGLQGVVKLHRNGKLLLLTGGFAQAAVSVQVSSDTVQACGHGGGQHDVGIASIPNSGLRLISI
uniref:Uncharacterized protein n=1 Tax=Takifugu rubripes TaxID=31033 RepID=A0A674MF44_TAKRU